MRGLHGAGSPSLIRRAGSPVRHATVAVLAAVAIAGPWGVHPLQAQGTADQLGLSAAPAFDGQSQGAWTPVTVTVAPSVPVQGLLEVSREGANGITISRLDVEVSAGATKEWMLLVPPGEGRATVRLTADDLEATTTVAGGAAVALVGVLGDPEFADRVGAVTDAVTGQVWQTTDLDPAVLDLGPLALESFGTLTAPAEAVAELDEGRRAALAAAVNLQGLHLVVTDVGADPGIGRPPAAVHAGGGLAVLPSGWPLELDADDVRTGSPDDSMAASITSGTGRVTWLTSGVADDALSSPRMWGHLWTGTPMATSLAWSRGHDGLDPWALQQSGVRLPSSWAMAGFAGGYLVLVGVVSLVLVRRLRRREAAWVVLPAMALVLAAVAFAASSGNQATPGRSLAQSTWVDGVGMERLALMIPPELDDEITLPGPGWAVEGLTWDNPAVVSATDDEVTLSRATDRDVFGVGVTMATRSAPAASPAMVDAVLTADGLRAEVTNTSPTALVDLRVSYGGLAQADIARIDPAATVVVELGTETVVVDGEVREQAGEAWEPIEADPMGTSEIGEEMILVEEDGEMLGEPALEIGPGSSFTAAANQRAGSSPAFVWIRAIAADRIVPSPAGPGAADPDVVLVATTPAVDPEARASGTTLVWQAPNGSHHDHSPAEGMLFGGGTTWLRAGVPTPPEPGQLRVDVPRTDAADACATYDVFDDDFSQSRVEELCGGAGPTCPDDAVSCETWPEGAHICTDEGCESWELQFTGTMAVSVWDRVEEEFRPWDAELEGLVARDPGRVLTPLGDVVVAIEGAGEFWLTEVDIGTGGGT